MTTLQEAPDIADIIAGALQVSRGTAYDLMRSALAQQGEQAKPVAYITDTHQGPAKFAPEEVARGNIGIRWVTEAGVEGRPTDHDVREYLRDTPTAIGCNCSECKSFYTAHPVNQVMLEALKEAATSLETIALQGGKDTYMMRFDQIRGYALNRANVANAAIAAAEAQPAQPPGLSSFEAGWRAASAWADRDDLIADIGSPAYLAAANKKAGL